VTSEAARPRFAGWEALAEAQAGVLTRRQALAHGLSSRQVSWLVASGRWVRLFPAVFGVHTGPRRDLTQVWAAVLHAGDGAGAGGATALWLTGAQDRFPAVPTICLPAGRRVSQRQGVRLVRRRGLDRLAHPAARPPRLRIEEAVLDVADEYAEAADVVSLVLRVTQRRLTTAGRLRDALARRRAHRWRRLLGLVLSDVVDGVQSVLEHEYLHRVERRHGLPRGRRNVVEGRRGSRRYRDLRYVPWKLVTELDGMEAHPDEERFRDKRRDNAVVLDGDVPLRFGWSDVAVDPCGVAAQVAAALKARGWGGRPRRCGPDCTVS
jgi:hypothetical protein